MEQDLELGPDLLNPFPWVASGDVAINHVGMRAVDQRLTVLTIERADPFLQEMVWAYPFSSWLTDKSWRGVFQTWHAVPSLDLNTTSRQVTYGKYLPSL